MYPILVALHSWMRWLVLITLIYALYRAYRGWSGSRRFSRYENTVRTTAVSVCHIQLVLGLILYFVSPLVQYFLDDTRNAIHQRQARFFGIEHITMMLIGIIVITIGSAKSNRKLTDRKKFRTMAVWFTIGLLIILSSVPWPFTSWASRPWFRGF